MTNSNELPDAAEGDGERKRRGRIPHEDWADILRRQRDGDTLATIARDYGCTPSAVSYVIKKAEAEGIAPSAAARPQTVAAPEAAAAAPLPAPEPQTARSTGTLRLSEPAAEPPVRAAPPPSPPPIATAVPTAAAKPAAEPSAQRKAPEGVVEPIDETEARLRLAARALLRGYRDWRGTPGPDTREKLASALHDLRKVTARIDIDMAQEHGRENTLAPIPIPRHRAAVSGPR